jgi:hypothetical protein
MIYKLDENALYKKSKSVLNFESYIKNNEFLNNNRKIKDGY